MTTDPVQLLIDAGAIPADPFAPNSRYHGVALALYSIPRPAAPSPMCCAVSSRSCGTSRSRPSTS